MEFRPQPVQYITTFAGGARDRQSDDTFDPVRHLHGGRCSLDGAGLARQGPPGRHAGSRRHDIRNVSHHYERPGEPLPEEIEKAIDDLHTGVKRRKNDRERGDAYRVGAAVLLDRMGQAGVDRGFKSGQDWSEPRDGEYRIDMPIEHWRRIRYLTHIGFQHQMPNYERMLHFPFDSEEDALQSEAAIEKLEFAIGHSKSDPEYSDSLARNMLIWNRWPQEQKA
jgi:hypothetical protein